MTAPSARHASLDRLDIWLIAIAAVLSAVTALLFLLPTPPLRVVAPVLDLTLDNFALVISALIAVLSWVRYRERHEEFALFQASAFLILAVANLVAVLDTLIFTANSTLPLSEPGDDQLYIFTAARLIAGGLLVVGGVRTLRGRLTPWPRLALAIPLAIFAVVIMFVAAGHPMPPLISDMPGSSPAMTALGGALQLLTAALFGWSAILARDLWRRDGAVADKFIALGLMVAAFAQIQAALYPGTHPGPVSAADLLRLGFYAILLLAIEGEARSVMSSLRKANVKLERLRNSEVERAAFEERARLSRELHDGLAQALWLAKLKIVRLLAQPGLNCETRDLAEETAAAVELGLNEARQAVLAMHTSATTNSAFSELLERYVNDYGDQFAIPVEFSADEPLPPLGARTQAELLRIAQEALANVHRHARASLVAVSVGVQGEEITLSVSDDGRGFDINEVSNSKFGLSAMRERAGLIGGRLSISSLAGRGTTVSVCAPLQPVVRPE